MKKILFWLCLLLGLVAVFEGASFISLRLLDRARILRYSPVRVASVSPQHTKVLQQMLAGKNKYLDYDAALGWSIKPNVIGTTYRSNAQGIRADRDYTLEPQDRILRISTFGDSYTHCDEVQNHQTWQAALQRSHDQLEVLNFGVPGYGLDQTHLRFRKNGLPYKSHIVFIGFMSGDIFRGVNTYRPFFQSFTGLPLSKPRYKVEAHQLQLIDNPMQPISRYQELLDNPTAILLVLGKNDFYYHRHYRYGRLDVLPSVRLAKAAYHKLSPRWDQDAILKGGFFNDTSEAYAVAIKTFDEFVADVKKTGATPIIVIFPYYRGIINYRKHRTKEYEPFLNYFRANAYNFIDVMDAFDTYGRDVGVRQLYKKRHYSELANQMIAKHMLEYLRTKAAL